MCIAASHPKRVHTNAFHLSSWEFHGLQWNSDILLVEGNPRIRFVKLDVWRNDVVLKAENGLYHCGQAGYPLAMTNGRFRGSNEDAIGPKNIGNRFGFNWIADRSSGSMALSRRQYLDCLSLMCCGV